MPIKKAQPTSATPTDPAVNAKIEALEKQIAELKAKQKPADPIYQDIAEFQRHVDALQALMDSGDSDTPEAQAHSDILQALMDNGTAQRWADVNRARLDLKVKTLEMKYRIESNLSPPSKDSDLDWGQQDITMRLGFRCFAAMVEDDLVDLLSKEWPERVRDTIEIIAEQLSNLSEEDMHELRVHNRRPSRQKKGTEAAAEVKQPDPSILRRLANATPEQLDKMNKLIDMAKSMEAAGASEEEVLAALKEHKFVRNAVEDQVAQS